MTSTTCFLDAAFLKEGPLQKSCHESSRRSLLSANPQQSADCATSRADKHHAVLYLEGNSFAILLCRFMPHFNNGGVTKVVTITITTRAE